MKRALPLVVLVVLVAVFVFWGLDDDSSDAHGLDAPAVAAIETDIGEGRLDAAVRDIESGRGLTAISADYLRSAVALAQGRNEDALTLSRRASEAAPASWRPFSVEYAALLGLDRRVEAGALARAAVERLPDDERVLAMAAHDYVSSESSPDPVAALELLDRIDALPVRRATEEDPTAVREEQLLQIRFMAETAAERYGAALHTARTMARRAPDEPSMQLFVGEAARRAGDLEAAAEAYRTAVDAMPGVLAWRENLVQILLELPEAIEEVLAETQALIEAAPASRSVRILRARALVRAEKQLPEGPDQAAIIYRKLLAERADDLEVLRNLAVLLYDWKQGGKEGAYLDEAHAHLRRYVRLGGELDDDLTDVWAQLESRAAARGEDDPARLARKAFDASPGDPQLATTLIEALATSGREHEVGAVVRRALEAAPEEPAIRVLAARHFSEPGADNDPALALSHLHAAAPSLGGRESLPEPLQWLRCRLLGKTDRHAEAYASAGHLLAVRPDAAPYLGARGNAALELGRVDEAVTDLRAALERDPTPDRQTDLSRALIAQPDGASEAVGLLEQALMTGGRTPDRGRLFARALLAIPARRAEGVRVLQAFLETYPEDVAGVGLLAAVVHDLGNPDVAAALLARYREMGGTRTDDVATVWDALIE